MKKTLLLFNILILSITYCKAQYPSTSMPEVIINYTYTYIINGHDSIKCKRTPVEERHKLSDIDQRILSYTLQTENYLDQRKFGDFSNDVYMSLRNLKTFSKNNNVFINLTDYKNELAFYNKVKSRSSDDIRREKIDSVFEQDYKEREIQKEKDRKWKENNNAIQKRNDSTKIADEKQTRINDSIAEINYQKEIAKQKKENALAQKHYAEQKIKKAEEEVEKKKRKHIELIEKYGNKNGEDIFKHKVQIGWTKEMCKESWGKPLEINKTTTANAVHEQWVYSLKKYLYFDNDILTAIQD